MTVDTDGTWKASKDNPEGWTEPDFDDSGWKSAKVYAEYPAHPWGELNYTYLPTVLKTHYPPYTVTDMPSDTVPQMRYQLFYRSLDHSPPVRPDLEPSTLELKTLVQGDVDLVEFEVEPEVNPDQEGVVPVEITSDVDPD